MTASKSELSRAVQQVAVEGGGLLVFDALHVRDIPLLAMETLDGDREAGVLLHAVTDLMRKVTAAPQNRPMLCVSCPRAVRSGAKYSIAVLRGAADNATQAIAFVVCPRCGPTLGAVRAAATVAVRKFFPDARAVEPTHQDGGRA